MNVTRFEWDGEEPDRLAAELRSLAPALVEVSDAVAEIVAAVAARGEKAVLDLCERFDGSRPPRLTVDPDEGERALAGLDPDLVTALRAAAANIGRVAESELPEGERRVELVQGHEVRSSQVAVAAAGLYAPGGYPSSVLMCAIPALVAGVERIAVVSPARPDGSANPLVLAAAAVATQECGRDLPLDVHPIGGAQAIAALALGTESIAAVDVIAGPGNRFVQEAKRQLAGRVGIDAVAGPSELMVVAGEGSRPDWLGLDLCAQAEHGSDGLLVAAAVETAILDRLESEVEQLAARSPSVAEAPLALVEVPDTTGAIELANALAPEHLEIATEDAALLAERVRSAGCVLVGERSATAFSDYAAGSNHVLPTGGAGRFTGPLGPATFMRRTAAVTISEAAATELAPLVATLASAEGFEVHAESATARTPEQEPR